MGWRDQLILVKEILPNLPIFSYFSVLTPRAGFCLKCFDTDADLCFSPDAKMTLFFYLFFTLLWRYVFFLQNISLDKDTYIKCKMMSKHMFFVFFDNNLAQFEYSKIGKIFLRKNV